MKNKPLHNLVDEGGIIAPARTKRDSDNRMIAARPQPRKKSQVETKNQLGAQYDGLPGSCDRPTGPDDSWRRIAAARAPAFDQSVPAYLLDEKYWFLDWNPAFDELVACPLGLKRLRNHAEDFIRELVNVEAVYQRSKKIFDPKNVPLIDVEPLVFHTEKYGDVEFEKIAVQISDTHAQLASWCVYLNITRAHRLEEMWDDLRASLESHLNWSRYALSYDKLLLNFDDYCDLVDLVVGKVSNCKRCLDLGAGTGNGTIKLLEADQDRNVWPIESNQAMIQQLISKLEKAEVEAGCDYFGRLHVLKENLLRLDDVKDILSPGSYDGAILINVLYAVEDPEKCLRQIFRLLQAGGRLVLSTSHRNTDVDKLFMRMQDVLERKNLFSQLSPNFHDARERHKKMEALIHRDTQQDIRGYLEGAGFRIVDWREKEYTDAVVVVEALKP
jgi:ubiquinone/menaquinone biosynthesis C-methylase UbiE